MHISFHWWRVYIGNQKDSLSGGNNMTKKVNKGSRNQNSPQNGTHQMELAEEHVAGDNSKGNKRNKDQRDKTRED